MTRISPPVLRTAALGLAFLSPAALAGTQSGIVTYLPSSLLGAATAVPTMSGNILIALGLIMAVIALRFLGGRAQQKALSLTILGAGLAIGGLGVQETLATSSIYVSNDECNTGGSQPIIELGRYSYFTNQCDVPVTLVSTVLNCPNGYAPAPGAANGTELAPQGQEGSQVQLAYCQPVEE